MTEDNDVTKEQIKQAFQDACEEFGDDKSTEFLLSITAERCNLSYSQVVYALADASDEEKP
jgi:GTP cyclohydrolase I